MMQTVSLLAILALAKIGLSSPVAASAAEGTIAASLGTAVGGALAQITEAAVMGVDIASPPEYLTITVINSHGDAISTSHAHNADGPSAVSGNVAPGTMSAGETAAFALPTGWAGNVAINDALWPITGDDSLIEASFVVADGYTVAVADVDVSYVNGFSVAITCSCYGTVVTGCNKNLFLLNTCPDNDGENACINPTRSSTTITTPSVFFAPCEHAAYTYPIDNAANSWGACQSGQITCCVGMACPPNQNQPA